MQTVAQTTRTSKPAKAFYAMLYDNEHGILGKIDGEILFFRDDGEIIAYEPEMAPWTTILGEVAASETALLLDTMRGGYAKIACTRAN
jgi:hypothetical protein